MPTTTTDLTQVEGAYVCPECHARYSSKTQMGQHRFAKHEVPDDWNLDKSYQKKLAAKAARKAARASGQPIPTSDVKPRAGKYHCPECGVSFPMLRVLGRHRVTHGIKGVSKSTLLAKAQRKKKQLPSASQGAQNGNSNSIEQATQSLPQNGASRKKAGWTDESIAGFIFAHIHTLIENACAGRENSIPDITQRLSELLHVEVHGKKARDGGVGMLRGLS